MHKRSTDLWSLPYFIQIVFLKSLFIISIDVDTIYIISSFFWGSLVLSYKIEKIDAYWEEMFYDILETYTNRH